MKTEIVRIPGKGICILISDLNPADFECIPSFSKGPFNDVHIIAELLRIGRRIAAIKEIRTQTGWGLKEAKEYTEKFLPMGSHDPFECEKAAKKFIKFHTFTDFLNMEEMKI